MSAVKMSLPNFKPFLDSQIGRIERNRDCKEQITIVFVKGMSFEEAKGLDYLLLDRLRRSDVVFQQDDYFFIVLQETDMMGGLHLNETFQEVSEREDMVVAIASLPEDGNSVDDLLNMLNRITKDNYNIEITEYLK
jgi:hypothetical protein